MLMRRLMNKDVSTWFWLFICLDQYKCGLITKIIVSKRKMRILETLNDASHCDVL